MTTRVPTLIVGAGQAGLALSRCLTEFGHEHLLVDRGNIAERWRSERWDSFTLLTPNWQTRLPAFRYTGLDHEGFMTREQVVEFFGDYARSFDAPVRTGVTVTGVHPAPHGWIAPYRLRPHSCHQRRPCHRALRPSDRPRTCGRPAARRPPVAHDGLSQPQPATFRRCSGGRRRPVRPSRSSMACPRGREASSPSDVHPPPATALPRSRRRVPAGWTVHGHAGPDRRHAAGAERLRHAPASSSRAKKRDLDLRRW